MTPKSPSPLRRANNSIERDNTEVVGNGGSSRHGSGTASIQNLHRVGRTIRSDLDRIENIERRDGNCNRQSGPDL